METEVRFRETQRFDQPWLWGLLVLSALSNLVKLVRGDRPVRETVRRLAPVAAAALLLRSATLRTEVREDGVCVEFAPFHRSFRRIPFSAVTTAEQTDYSPLRYGGWGIRWTPTAVAYTVGGRSGVRLDRRGEKSVFVGSKRPEEFAAAVREASGQTA